MQHEGEPKGPAEGGWYPDALRLIVGLIDRAKQGTYATVEIDYRVDKKLKQDGRPRVEKAVWELEPVPHLGRLL